MAFEDLDLMEKAERIRDKALELLYAEAMSGHGVDEQFRRLAGIPAKLRPFTRLPNPEHFNGPIEQLEMVAKTLSTGSSGYMANPWLNLSDVGNDIASWNGPAARAFRTNFVAPFPAIAHNQFLLVCALKSALEAEKALWEAARKDIASITSAAYRALERMDASDDMSVEYFLKVVAAAAALSAIPFAGGLAVMRVAAIGASAQFGGVIASRIPPKTDRIRGANVLEFVESLERAIFFATDAIIETEDRIRTTVTELHKEVLRHVAKPSMGRNWFCARRPALADSSKQTIRRDMGYTE